MTRGVQTDMEASIVAALEAHPGATLAQLSDVIPDETPARVAACLHYLTQQAKPPRILRTGETRWYRYWIPGTVPENPEPVPRDIRVGNIKGSPGHTAQLIAAIRANPGITAVELGKRTEIVDGAKILAVLVRRGQLQAVGPRKQKRYYALGCEIPAEAITTATAALAKASTGTLELANSRVAATAVAPQAAAEDAADPPPPRPLTPLESAIASLPTPSDAPDEAAEAGASESAAHDATALDISINASGQVYIRDDTGDAICLSPAQARAAWRFLDRTWRVWSSAGKAPTLTTGAPQR